MSMETSKTKIGKEKKGTEYPKTVGQLQNVLTYMQWKYQKQQQKENGTQEIFEVKMTEISPN